MPHQARTDLAAIEDDLQFIMGQLARLPTRKELRRAALLGTLAGAALVDFWFRSAYIFG